MKNKKNRIILSMLFQFTVFVGVCFSFNASALDVCGNFSSSSFLPVWFHSPETIGINYSSSADTILVGSLVKISASCENGSLVGGSSVGSFSPNTSTTYYATCQQPDGRGGTYSATACINIFVDNGCASTTCTDRQCNNGIGLVWGTLPVTYNNYNCTYFNSFDCSLEDNCGKIDNITATCGAIRTCDGQSVFDRPLSECGSTCASSTVACPGCQLKIKAGGFIEVAP